MGAGHRPGAPGVSHHDRPGKNGKAFAARMCPQCGRTDLLPLRTIQKLVRELTARAAGSLPGRLPGIAVSLYSITPGRCRDCRIRVLPETGVLPGTSFGGDRARAQEREELGEGRQGLLGNLFGATLSVGAISNCAGAIASRLDRGVMEIRSETISLGHGAERLFPSPVRPPPEAPASRYGQYDSLLARHATVWTMSRQLPVMVQILETSTMEPWSQTGETGQKVAGAPVQVPVHETRRTAMISVAENRRRETPCFHASGMARRPFLHDGNTTNTKLCWWQPAGRRLDARDRALRRLGLETEVRQFDRVHVIRNVEEAVMGAGVGTPEHAAPDMLRGACRAAKGAAAGVAARAGGDLRPAYEIDRVSRVPGLSEYVGARTAELQAALRGIITGCGSARISTIISNAAPCLLTFITYPGMPPHTNGVERTIRARVAVTRKANGPFPNWKAARNYSALQTLAATCERHGVTPCEAVRAMAGDPDWNLFTARVPPPVLAG